MKVLARALPNLLLLTLGAAACGANESDRSPGAPASAEGGATPAETPRGATESPPGGGSSAEPGAPPTRGSPATPASRESPPELPLAPSAPEPASPADAAEAGEPSQQGEPGDAAASSGSACATPRALDAGNHSLSLQHDGEQREYLVHVPEGLEPERAVPLVVDLHGLTSSAAAQAALSGWRAKADSEGFIVAHPQGLGASWNGGDLCCGSAQREGVDDEGFIRALVARLAQDACIDARRVYATGLSNGGAMSHLLACNAADLFAAAAPVSMGNGTRPCQPSRPISVVLTRGTRDALVAFDGGLFPSAQQDFESWAALNACEGEPVPTHGLCQSFERCAGGVRVEACALDAGHVLYSNAQDFSVPDVVWETFEGQRLP